MCGFAGFSVNGLPDAEKVIDAMGNRITHRGPDQAASYVDQDIALGFRRLAIIDLSGGSQPIFNEDRSMVLVFNGEIYNYQSIRADLLQKGHVFSTETDSEVLLHGYEEYGGKGLLDKLRGMYAFVIWDKKEKKLFGARDIFGIKPFYYYKKGDTFLFGSEIKSFLEHTKIKKELNEERLPDWLCYEYVPDNETMFKNVYKLPSGCCFTWQNGEMKVERYYEVTYKIDESKTLEEWEELIAKTFTESVQAHQIADVEVGCFLSSGIDSSYVVQEVAKCTSDVKTFTVGYEEEKYSELSYAQDFSKVVGVQNISNKINADDYFGMASKIQYYMDEPLPNPSEVPLYFLAQNAAKYVKVVLSGEGADELFGGYPMYLAGGHFQKYSRIPRQLRKAAAGVVKHMPDFKGKQFILRGAMEPYQRFMRANYNFTFENRDQVLKKKYHAKDPTDYARPLFERMKGFDEPTTLQYVDMYTWMLYDILQKADRMSMANSLELRVPFLDKKMLELAVQIPTRYRAYDEVTKRALRGAAIKEIPERTANKKKLGFPVPLSDWLRQDKYYEMVREKFDGEVAAMFFNHDYIRKMLDDHKNGVHLNMKKIWVIYTFILWYEEFFIKN